MKKIWIGQHVFHNLPHQVSSNKLVWHFQCYQRGKPT